MNYEDDAKFDFMDGGSPANGDDVTRLLQNLRLPALPCLRAAQIKAAHASVGPVDMDCLADLEHLALVCAELTLRDGGRDPSLGPASLHIVVDKPSPEMVHSRCCAFFSHDACKHGNIAYATMSWARSKQVVVLQRMKAGLSMICSEDPTSRKRLQQWKAGLPHALDLKLPRGVKRVDADIPELWFEEGFEEESFY